MKASPFVGKKCYHHLGGKLSAALFDFLLQEGWIAPQEDTPNAYAVTEKGSRASKRWGWSCPRKLNQKPTLDASLGTHIG